MADRLFAHRSPSFATRVLGAVCLFCLVGCDVPKLVANTTSGLFDRAAPAFEELWDYDLAGEAIPGSLIQLEGILHVTPDNPEIALATLKAYIGYGYGWLEDEAELADFNNKLDEVDMIRARAKKLYRRALDLSLHVLNLEVPGVYAVIDEGHDSFLRWLRKNFTESEDAEILLWAGQAWGLYINVGSGDMEIVADLPMAKALVQRSVELDPKFFYSAGKMLLATIAASEFGGDMVFAKRYFDDAMRNTQRKNLMVHVNMARYYAVQTGDYKLYKELLNEVMNAGDVLPKARLNNVIARRKAERYLKRADYFFSELN